MCGIVGFTNKNNEIKNPKQLLVNMTEKLKKRGESSYGYYIKNNVYLGHRRLSIIDIEGGIQPMSALDNKGNNYTIVYNGEIYNTKELKNLLTAHDIILETTSDTEIILKGYIIFKEKILNYLTGIFAFVIYDENLDELFLARDQIGVKPLFYTLENNELIFASEIKAILENKKIKRVLDIEGIQKLFGIGPARMKGQTVFSNIHEIKPGYYAKFKNNEFIKNNELKQVNKLKEINYYKISSYTHTDDIETTKNKIRFFLERSIKSQLVADVNVGCFLSGGVDSSIITAVASKNLNKEILKTFSVDYIDNDKNFIKSDFTPSRDNEYIEVMKNKFNLNHKYITLDNKLLYDSLYEAMLGRDIPSMADIDSSLLLLCREVKKDVTVSLSGEFSDEIFCGYPWFFREESLSSNTFPWSTSLNLREELLNKNIKDKVNLKKYVSDMYKEAISEVPLDETKNNKDITMKILSYLTMFYFGANLLDRSDRMSMLSSLEVRVPFADHNLVEYVYNIPWDIKNINNMEKGILRESFKDLIPEEVLFRKKSPYPKTFSPAYTNLVIQELEKILNDKDCKIRNIINIEYIREIIKNKDDTFKVPWFGQLMQRPQLLAYLIQLEMWINEYNIEVKLY